MCRVEKPHLSLHTGVHKCSLLQLACVPSDQRVKDKGCRLLQGRNAIGGESTGGNIRALRVQQCRPRFEQLTCMLAALSPTLAFNWLAAHQVTRQKDSDGHICSWQ